jgi:hypothetical protein
MSKLQVLEPLKKVKASEGMVNSSMVYWFRYCFGEKPVFFLKYFEKLVGS